MSMTNNQEIEQNKCEHCNRSFVRPTTFFKHMCEQKRRFMDKDKPGNRIGYNAWKEFYQRHHPNKRSLEYSDFMNSSYYSAFVKFGSYCVDIKAVNTGAYAVYLIKNQISIDNWASDRSYTKYLIEYLKVENCLDAVKRSIENLLDVSIEQNINLTDSFRYINSNKICYMITTGQISPWVLYQSDAGKQFLSSLDTSQTNLIFEYIDPERWNIKFKREPENVIDVRSILKGIPL